MEIEPSSDQNVLSSDVCKSQITGAPILRRDCIARYPPHRLQQVKLSEKQTDKQF